MVGCTECRPKSRSLNISLDHRQMASNFLLKSGHFLPKNVEMFLRAVLAFLMLTVYGVLHAQNFDVSEFPNYFLPPALRGMSAEEISRNHSAELLATKRRLNAALGMMFSRLTVPLVMNESEGPKNYRYFDTLYKELRPIDSDIKIMPSSGVLRSAIGFLYQELYTAEQTGNSAVTTLEAIAAGKHNIYDSKGNLPALSLQEVGNSMRGVGSDFDVQLIVGKAENFPAARDRAFAITNSAEISLGLRNADMNKGFKASLFPPADVKSYHTITVGGEVIEGQAPRSSAQGGATVDLLAYDMEAKEIKEPKEYLPKENIVDDLLMGFVSYIEPAKDPETGREIVEDGPKQTIRGLRSLLEIPYTRLKQEKRLVEEIRELKQNIKDEKLSRRAAEKAIEQFPKMVRNSRFSGAANRYHRGGEGSFEKEVEELLAVIEEKYNVSTVPEFVDNLRIGRPSQSMPDELPLMAMSRFRQSVAKDGIVYHGTPQVDQGLAILRNGLFLSKSGGRILGGRHTVAVYGRGGYTSPSYATSAGYARSEGVVFQLRIKNDPNLRILDWQNDQVQKSSVVQRLMVEENNNIDAVFERLTREHGVDVILNGGHVLVQNSQAVEFPAGFRGLIRSYDSLVKNKLSSLQSRIEAFRTVEKLKTFIRALGEAAPRTTSRSNLRTELYADFGNYLATEANKEKIMETAKALIEVGSPVSHVVGKLQAARANASEEKDQKYLSVIRGIVDSSHWNDPKNLKDLLTLSEGLDDVVPRTSLMFQTVAHITKSCQGTCTKWMEAIEQNPKLFSSIRSAIRWMDYKVEELELKYNKNKDYYPEPEQLKTARQNQESMKKIEKSFYESILNSPSLRAHPRALDIIEKLENGDLQYMTSRSRKLLFESKAISHADAKKYFERYFSYDTEVGDNFGAARALAFEGLQFRAASEPESLDTLRASLSSGLNSDELDAAAKTLIEIAHSQPATLEPTAKLMAMHIGFSSLSSEETVERAAAYAPHVMDLVYPSRLTAENMKLKAEVSAYLTHILEAVAPAPQSIADQLGYPVFLPQLHFQETSYAKLQNAILEGMLKHAKKDPTLAVILNNKLVEIINKDPKRYNIHSPIRQAYNKVRTYFPEMFAAKTPEAFQEAMRDRVRLIEGDKLTREKAIRQIFKNHGTAMFLGDEDSRLRREAVKRTQRSTLLAGEVEIESEAGRGLSRHYSNHPDESRSATRSAMRELHRKGRLNCTDALSVFAQ